MTEQVKIYFRLQQDEEGYPGVSVESVWAKPGKKSDEYILDNIPFFVREATIGDALRVRKEEGALWFDGLASKSLNSLIRIVFFDSDCVEKVAQEVRNLGCEVEYSKDYNLLAVNVPGNVKLSDVQAYLQREADEGHVDFEEPILRQ